MATFNSVMSNNADLLKQSSFNHPLQDDQGTDFSRVALPAIVRTNVDGLPAGVEGLHLLAQQGSWRPLIQVTKSLMGAGASASTAERLVATTFHILGLTKLRMYGAAVDELRGVAELSLPKSPPPARSPVPFALYFLSAHLPHRLGQTQASIDALYELMQYCKEQVEACSSLPPTASSSGGGEDGELNCEGGEERKGERVPEDSGVWLRRQEMVLYTLLTHHLQNQDFGVTLQWLDRLLIQNPRDPVVVSQVGYVLLQLGDVEGAERCFQAAAQEVRDGEAVREEASVLVALLHRNQGLLLFAQKKYQEAQAEFRSALDEDPSDVASVNNHAMCSMYQRDLMGACRFLEESLQSDPVSYIDEALVLNLCSMYDLAWLSGTDHKRKLSSWISKIAPDDFDLNCTRL